MADESAAAGTSVFLVRTEPTRFERTLQSPVDLDALPDRPSALDDRDAVRLWGVPEGDQPRDSFERMESGDLLLFHHDGRYVGVGRVGQTFEDAEWASGPLEDDGVGGAFTVEDFEEIDVGRAAVHRIFEYSPSYAPGDLMHVAEDRVTNELDAIELAVRRYDEQQG